MHSLTLGLEENGAHVILSGDTQELWRNRRIAIYFRDFLKAVLLDDGRISVPIGGAQLGPLLRTIEESLARGGFQSSKTETLSSSVAAFQKAEEQIREH